MVSHLDVLRRNPKTLVDKCAKTRNSRPSPPWLRKTCTRVQLTQRQGILTATLKKKLEEEREFENGLPPRCYTTKLQKPESRRVKKTQNLAQEGLHALAA